MDNVSFSPLAESDIENAFNYIAGFNIQAARKFIKELMQKFKLLAGNPQLGRSQNKLLFNLRSFPYKSHTIYYFPTGNGVEIYRVLHGARNVEDLFDDFFEGLEP